MTDLQNIIFNNKEKTFLQYKNTHIKKLKHLISRSSTTTCKIASKTINTFNTAATSSSIQDKWVINFSKKELTPEEKSVLQKDPKFAVTPATIPIKEYISTTTVAALQAGELNGIDCSGLYHDVNRILNTYTNKPVHTNITKSEHLALQNLRKDRDHIIVTADQGVALVVMDKTEYITKCEALLGNSVYQHLSKDTSPTIHKELIKILQDYKNNNFISETKYTLLRPHGSNSPAARFYSLPKIHKNNIPLCPTVSAWGTATYNTAKFITKILQYHCGKTTSFVKDSTDIIKKIKHLLINPEEETLVSFDVSALFTSIPVPVALQVINSKISTCTNFTNVCKILQKNSSSFWNSLSPTAFSASTRNSINNYRLQPWVCLSPLSLQISIWNILNP